jgi:ABC-2 type transport system ATP-binding protein
MTSMLRFDRVSLQFGVRAALLDVSCDLEPGLVGLLGPNGAGKTTFLSLAAGLRSPTTGQITWRGVPAGHPDMDNEIAVVADGDQLPRRDSPLQFVTTLLRAAGVTTHDAETRARHTLERLGLAAKLHEPLRQLSRGQRQRVKLAQAFALPASLILLDEPLNALDPVWRLEIAALMREAVQGGACVLLSSHILEEVEPLADWLVLLFRGRLVATGTRSDIQSLLSRQATAVRVHTDQPRPLARELLGLAEVSAVSIEGEELRVQAPDLTRLHVALPQAVVASGAVVRSVTSEGNDLVTLFQALSEQKGRALRGRA